MSKNKPGISTIEVVIVLAISSVLFIIAIGSINFRKRTEVDDAARQVMSQISTIRNEAQQGMGPDTEEGAELLRGNELFGVMIEFVEGQGGACGAGNSCMRVYKLMQEPVTNGKIQPFELETIILPIQLRFFTPSASPPACNVFTSCYASPPSFSESNLTLAPIGLNTTSRLMLVIRNNSGQTYVKSRPLIEDIDDPNFMGTQADRPDKYTSVSQGRLRVSMARIENTTGDFATQIANAPYQYYARFDLAIPNNQSLEVVR